MVQTAVQWLVEQLMERDFINKNKEIIEQAKAMEKEQLNIARLDGINLANKGYGKYYFNYDTARESTTTS